MNRTLPLRALRVLNPLVRSMEVWTRVLLILSLLASLLAAGCGGGSSNSSASSAVQSAQLSGNWQFTLTGPSDNSFVGGPQGGFLLQDKGKVTGGLVYSVGLPQSNSNPIVCNSGSAAVTGSLSGQTVSLTAIAGSQTFAFSGALSSDGKMMTGTYTTTDGNGCGTAQTGLPWTAVFVPPLNGSVQGNFHSTGSGSSTSLRDQNFPVTGTLTQGENIGASNTTVTGTLTFTGYPCMTFGAVNNMVTASVNGQISGTSVILQIIEIDGLNAGQIGAPMGSSTPFPAPATFDSVAGGGLVLHGMNAYGINTSSCKQSNLPGDVGNVCLALGNSTACTQPIILSPATVKFPGQLLGSTPNSQTVVVTNTDPAGATLNGLTVNWQVNPGSTSFNNSDFTGLPNYSEQDTCASAPGTPFSLAPQQSCSITVTFSPQQGCPWLPSMSVPAGAPPPSCPVAMTANLSVSLGSATNPDTDLAFAVPVSGTGLSLIKPSTAELDFGAESVGESSLPQTLTFTNQGLSSVQILPPATPCSTQAVQTLPRPLVPGAVPGLQVVTGTINPNVNTINYVCDSDLTSTSPNFQISSDTCSGRTLAPLQSCDLQIAFAPQPATSLNPALDYFLELNTLECSPTATTDCEIDSGRFPVELKANLPSPLRMSPGAALEFGSQTKGQTSNPLTVTLFNDPNDPSAAAINFSGIVASGDYHETNNCGASLASGSSCTLTVTFTPSKTGSDSGNILISYVGGQTQTIYLRGSGK